MPTAYGIKDLPFADHNNSLTLLRSAICVAVLVEMNWSVVQVVVNLFTRFAWLIVPHFPVPIAPSAITGTGKHRLVDYNLQTAMAVS